jgi:hypothetical protein
MRLLSHESNLGLIFEALESFLILWYVLKYPLCVLFVGQNLL